MTETVHSLDPWFVARYLPRLERTARQILGSVGFENWYPTVIAFKPMPLRKISPAKRHLAQWFIREQRKPRFQGYILVRPLPWCRHDINRLCELSGCGSIVTFAGKPARVQDFDVEIMRIAEATGLFDEITYAGPPGRYRITRTVEATTEWVSQGKRLLELDETRKFRVFLDALGRFERVVAEDQHSNFYNRRGRLRASRSVPSSLNRGLFSS